MPFTRTAISAYQAAQLTVSPLQAIVMLYDGVITLAMSAAAAARRRDYETQFKDVKRANDILNGLNMMLDMEKGGRVACSLREMYEAVSRAMLSSIGRSSGAECCERIAAAVRVTRDAWAEISGLKKTSQPG